MICAGKVNRGTAAPYLCDEDKLINGNQRTLSDYLPTVTLPISAVNQKVVRMSTAISV